VGHHILVVDDEPMFLRIMVRALHDEGHSVIEALDGHVALEFARSTCKLFDLVITDSLMPELGGRRLIQGLRDLHPELRILHMTGAPRGDRLGYPGLPADVPTLYKPFHMVELMQEVRDLLAA
jgi:DNA-binding response OmpR family regulator